MSMAILAPEEHKFESDQYFPNSLLPVLVYSSVIEGKATAFEGVFVRQGWSAIAGHAPGVYPYHHFHSTAHEVLGFVAGTAAIRFGGPSGKSVVVSAGDVVVVPAGMAHFNDGQSDDVLIVVAYPEGTWADQLRGEPAQREAAEGYSRGAGPRLDPVPGYSVLERLWTQAARVSI